MTELNFHDVTKIECEEVALSESSYISIKAFDQNGAAVDFTMYAEGSEGSESFEALRRAIRDINARRAA